MGIEVNESGLWVNDKFISWDDIRHKVVDTYPADNMVAIGSASCRGRL